jgi:alginate O-acetyltransferase complex protein AlgI
MVVMLLGGLWHGASANFVIWGGIHGGGLAVERWAGKRGWAGMGPVAVRRVVTFVVVCVAWVFFRAVDFGSALRYLGSLCGMGREEGSVLIGGLIWQRYYWVSFAVAAVVVWGMPQSWDLTRRITWGKFLWIAAVFVAAVAMLFAQSYNPFIYFIF